MHPIQVDLVRLSKSLLHHLKTIKTSDDEAGVSEATEAALNVLVEGVEIIHTISSKGLKVTVPLILLSGIVRSRDDPVKWEEVDEKDNMLKDNPWFKRARPLAEIVERMATEHNANQDIPRRSALKRRRTEVQPGEDPHAVASDTPHSSKKRRGGDAKHRKRRESKTPAPALLEVKQEPDENVILSDDQDKICTRCTDANLVCEASHWNACVRCHQKKVKCSLARGRRGRKPTSIPPTTPPPRSRSTTPATRRNKGRAKSQPPLSQSQKRAGRPESVPPTPTPKARDLLKPPVVTMIPGPSDPPEIRSPWELPPESAIQELAEIRRRQSEMENEVSHLRSIIDLLIPVLQERKGTLHFKDSQVSKLLATLTDITGSQNRALVTTAGQMQSSEDGQPLTQRPTLQESWALGPFPPTTSQPLPPASDLPMSTTPRESRSAMPWPRDTSQTAQQRQIQSVNDPIAMTTVAVAQMVNERDDVERRFQGELNGILAERAEADEDEANAAEGAIPALPIRELLILTPSTAQSQKTERVDHHMEPQTPTRKGCEAETSPTARVRELKPLPALVQLLASGSGLAISPPLRPLTALLTESPPLSPPAICATFSAQVEQIAEQQLVPMALPGVVAGTPCAMAATVKPGPIVEGMPNAEAPVAEPPPMAEPLSIAKALPMTEPAADVIMAELHQVAITDESRTAPTGWADSNSQAHG